MKTLKEIKNEIGDFRYSCFIKIAEHIYQKDYYSPNFNYYRKTKILNNLYPTVKRYFKDEMTKETPLYFKDWYKIYLRTEKIDRIKNNIENYGKME